MPNHLARERLRICPTSERCKIARPAARIAQQHLHPPARTVHRHICLPRISCRAKKFLFNDLHRCSDHCVQKRAPAGVTDLARARRLDPSACIGTTDRLDRSARSPCMERSCRVGPRMRDAATAACGRCGETRDSHPTMTACAGIDRSLDLPRNLFACGIPAVPAHSWTRIPRPHMADYPTSDYPTSDYPISDYPISDYPISRFPTAFHAVVVKSSDHGRFHWHFESPQFKHVIHPSISTTAAVLHFAHSCAPSGK
jgi:hypothetical protein